MPDAPVIPIEEQPKQRAPEKAQQLPLHLLKKPTPTEIPPVPQPPQKAPPLPPALEVPQQILPRQPQAQSQPLATQKAKPQLPKAPTEKLVEPPKSHPTEIACSPKAKTSTELMPPPPITPVQKKESSSARKAGSIVQVSPASSSPGYEISDYQTRYHIS